MSIILKGGSSSDLADVTTGKALKVAVADTPATAGYVRILPSDGDELLSTENGYLRVSQDNMVFADQVEGAALNTNLWLTSALTQTITQANGFIILNTAAVTTVSTYSILTSIKQIPVYGHLPVQCDINAKVNIQPMANATIELGLGFAATTAAPTDGAFFRWTTAGELRCVLNFNGTETVSAPITAPTSNEVHLFTITMVEDLGQFFIDDEVVAEIEVPVAQAYPVNNGHQAVFARTLCAASAPGTGPQLSIGQVVVTQQAINQNRPWRETLAAFGHGAYQAPLTAFGQTANQANSTTPASATLANTTAGYTTLGGRYQFAAPAGAATDFALFAYQVPAGFQLWITSVTITAMNTGAAVATTPTILDWSVGVNSSAISLATADGAGTWAPRRIPVGLQGFPLTAPTGPAGIGDAAPEISRVFDPPLICDSARYFHIILSVPVGTATASQIIRGTITVTGYFE